MRSRRMCCPRPHNALPEDPRPASFRLPCTSRRDRRSAGTSPNNTPTQTETVSGEQQHAAVDRDLVQARHALRAEDPHPLHAPPRTRARARRPRARAGRFRRGIARRCGRGWRRWRLARRFRADAPARATAAGSRRSRTRSAGRSRRRRARISTSGARRRPPAPEAARC